MGFFSTQRETPLPAVVEETKPQESLPPAKQLPSTLITEGITVQGTVSGEGVVQVEGVVEGKFHMVGAVIVADTGVVRGPIAADVVRVAGRVEGNVIAREHMRLESTGILIGDVATASLVVEDGGALNGRSTMTRAPEPEPELQSVPDQGPLKFGPDYDPDAEAE